MNRPRIKICGVTRATDARLAVKLGADYIGCVFHRKSPRAVTLEQAKALGEAAGPLAQMVAVFVDERVERIVRVSHALKAPLVQLHGGQNARCIRSLQREGLKVALAYQVTSNADWKAVRANPADFALLDNRRPGMDGGTGMTFDWSLAPKRVIANLILAGGLNIANFAEGASLFSPSILDFNSGIESAPGKKSSVKMRKLFAEISKRYPSN